MTDDWYTSDYPDLRPGPPWVMEEMIRAQAALPDDICARSTARRRSAPLRFGRWPPASESSSSGCGTSEHAAMAVAALLRDGLASSAREARGSESQQALDAALDPCAGRPRHRCQPRRRDTGHLARARPRASRRRRHRGDHRAADSDVAAAADHVLSTPLHDRSWCHTVAYTSAILAGAAIAYAESGAAWPAVARARSKPPSPLTAPDRPREPSTRHSACCASGIRIDLSQCPRARAQDRGGRAHRGDRPSPRDPAPWAPGRLRARVDANRLPRRRPPASSIPTADGWCSPPRPPPRSAFRSTVIAPRDILTLLPAPSDAVELGPRRRPRTRALD